jgi:probable rRNA maturation factor
MPLKANISKIRFHIQHKNFSLQNRTNLKIFLSELFQKESIPLGSLSYIFCTDEFLLQLNKKYLKHNYYTDVISFDLTNKKGPLAGEIYISIDRVKDNAGLLKQTYYKELHRVIFHGALHLCGFNDKSVIEKLIMRKKEDKYISLYFK